MAQLAPKIMVGSQPSDVCASNYEVRNHLDRLVYTTNDATIARRWARDKAPLLGDLIIEEVTVEIKRRRVTTVRARAGLKVVPS